MSPDAHSTKLRGFVVPAALLIAAEVAAKAYHLQSDTLVAPSEIARAMVVTLLDGSLLFATLQTLGGALGGLMIGLLLGLTLGTALGVSRLLDRLMFVSVEIFRPIPSIALVPIAMLFFGFGFRLEISVVAFATFWPVLLLTRAAVAGIEPRLMEVSRLLGLGPFGAVRKIILPAALPRIFVGFRLAAGVALIVGVTVEVTANPIGLGYGIVYAQQSLHPATMLAFLCWVGVVGWALNAGLLQAQKRLFGPAAVVEAAP